MAKKELKSKILASCVERQKGIISNLKNEMQEAQKSANDSGLPKDRYDSYRAQLLRKRDMFAQQLHKANEQINTLNIISMERKYKCVEFGAVVCTNKQNIFISISLGKIEVEKDQYFIVSPFVPIYKAMEGKTAGEQFEFNGKKLLIKEIF